MGDTTALWLGFGEALAPVAGALTGLLFVALSVRSEVFAASRSLRSRAAETLVGISRRALGRSGGSSLRGRSRPA